MIKKIRQKISSLLKPDLESYLSLILGIAFGVTCTIGYIYYQKFGRLLPAGDSRGEWGATGDFFGGILNPAFSLITVFLLLITLVQNQKALESSREELSLSRKEMQDSNKALNAQAITLEKQRFEDTFFALLEQLNRALEKITADSLGKNLKGELQGRESAADGAYKAIFGNDWNTSLSRHSNILFAGKAVLLDHSGYLNQYFRLLYQLLKLVVSSSPTSPPDAWDAFLAGKNAITSTEKFYANIVRSSVPDNIYYLLAVNCCVTGGLDPYRPYKLMIERFAFFEHMKLDSSNISNTEILNEIIVHYDASAFGTNGRYHEIAPLLIRNAEDALLAPSL